MTAPAKRRWFLRFSLRTLLIVVTLLGIWLGVVCDRAIKQRRAVETIQGLGGQVIYVQELDPVTRKRRNVTPPGPIWLHEWLGEEYFYTIESVSLVGSGRDPNSRAYFPLRDEHITGLPLEGLRDVKMLSLGTVELSDESLRTLLSSLRLEELGISGTVLTDGRLKIIGNLSQLRRLLILFPGKAQRPPEKSYLTDPRLQEIAGLRSLKSLLLSGSDFTDDCLPTIGRLATLEDLHLSYARISNEGLAQLSNLAGLHTLGLTSTPITDTGLEHLTRLPSLKRVELLGTRVTNAGVELFDTLKVEVSAPDAWYFSRNPPQATPPSP